MSEISGRKTHNQHNSNNTEISIFLYTDYNYCNDRAPTITEAKAVLHKILSENEDTLSDDMYEREFDMVRIQPKKVDV